MAQVKENKFGRYVEGVIELDLRAYLSDGDTRETIPDDEALRKLESVQEDLSGSNDGSEAIANAGIIIK